MKQIIWVVIVVLSIVTLNAQEKFEKEIDLDAAQVPDNAMAFFKGFSATSDIDWYYEYNLVGNSIEAKFCFQKKEYSIEFDTLGRLQDIEIECKFKQIERQVKEQIHHQLSETYNKYKIIRTQKQYSGPIDSFGQFINDYANSDNITIRYELEIKAKEIDKFGLYEMTFSKTGNLIKSEKIILRNTEHFEY